MSTQSQRLDLVPEKIGGLAALARVAEENGKASINDLTFRDMDDEILKAYLSDFEEFAGEEARIKLAYMMEEASEKVQSIAKLAFKRKAYALVKAEVEKRANYTQVDRQKEQEAEGQESQNTEGSVDEDSEDGESSEDLEHGKSSEDSNDDESSEQISDEDVVENKSAAKEDGDEKEEKKPWEVPLTVRQVASAELAKKIRHFASNEDAQYSIPTDIEQRKAIWEQLETNPLLLCWSKTSAKKGRVFESTTDLTYRFSIKEAILVTNFSLRIENEEDVKGLKKFMASEKAQTYLTQPPLPINLHLLLAWDYPVNNVTIQCELKPCFASKLLEIALQLTGIAVKQFPSSKKTIKWSDSLMKMENDEDAEVLGHFVELFNKKPSFTRDAVFAAPIVATEAETAAEAGVVPADEQDEKVEDGEADVLATISLPEETQKEAFDGPLGKKSERNKKAKKSTASTAAISAAETPSEKETQPTAGKKSKKSKKSKKAKADTTTTPGAAEEPREAFDEPSASLPVDQRCVVN